MFVTSVPTSQPAPSAEKDLPPEIVEWLRRRSQRIVGRYDVSALVKCLACAYDDYMTERVEPVGDLWRKRRGLLLHNGLTYAFTWRELKVTHEFELEHETLNIVARLDTYVPERQTVYDFKSTDDLDWQAGRGYLPRLHDILQLQCYSTIFRRYIPISDLRLIYLDKASWKIYPVPLEDKLEWLTSRAIVLHKAIKAKARPTPDSDCWVCSRLPRRGGSP